MAWLRVADLAQIVERTEENDRFMNDMQTRFHYLRPGGCRGETWQEVDLTWQEESGRGERGKASDLDVGFLCSLVCKNRWINSKKQEPCEDSFFDLFGHLFGHAGTGRAFLVVPGPTGTGPRDAATGRRTFQRVTR